ncbi:MULTISPECIES: hypothetical protein [Bacillus cereus group]|uniref:Uncharacterized protein n=1 Tax=Bacillus cereus TaxID=1396 RepID=A0AA44Q8C8_BACCE|nr:MULTISPECIES: hypothetical protein [Bacillus cereus group]EEL47943.1 hypothetical protein bcere0022_49070 [Bacillus cereus Rock3-44]PFA22689.1 hypothetical protein CN373_08845 [Bacillus cereus]PFN03531.1 hypothetical protein COJ55_23020 [Bacillus cereus]PFO79847.1 hypothetical protein COJ77_19680 [Bacillus cereus]PFR24598.1 hypothetical protein COK19_17135 [Bacillus cereus]
MTSPNLKSYIQQYTHFITDLEEIVDIIIEKQHVYFYDTSAISSHEKAYFHHNKTLFLDFIKDVPIVITDVIVREMRLLEDEDRRYLNYLLQFQTVLYVEEQQLYELLKIEFNSKQAKQKFLIACEHAFSCIQPLKESVRNARSSFANAENIIFDDYISFFVANHQKNHGEMSLLWTSCIINQLRCKLTVTFMGIDRDLFSYVESSYFLGKKKADNIYMISNETLLQSDYIQHQNEKIMYQLVEIYRNEKRKVIYYDKKQNILQLTRQSNKLSNDEIIAKIISNQIQIIY